MNALFFQGFVAGKVMLLLACVVMLLLMCGCGAPSAKEIKNKVSSPQDSVSANLPPSQTLEQNTVGKVVEVYESAVKITNDNYPEGKIFAGAADLKVLSNGTDVGLDHLRPGDLVSIKTEQRGNRSDGWQALAVKVNLMVESPRDEDETTSLDRQTHIEEDSYETNFKGVVIAADATTVTIHDPERPDLEPSVLPLDPIARVSRNGEILDVTSLSKGDQIEMTAESRGNRQDGYVRVVTKIRVTQSSDEAN